MTLNLDRADKVLRTMGLYRCVNSPRCKGLSVAMFCSKCRRDMLHSAKVREMNRFIGGVKPS